MSFEGEISLMEEYERVFFVLDAEPHVMSRLRKIFENARPYYNRGQYTHKPLTFPITLSACKDLLWLMDRYSLDCEEEVLDLIKLKSGEYDSITKAVAEADGDTSYAVSPKASPIAVPLRPHQIRFRNMFLKVKRMLLADKIGAGKTASALSILQEPESRPALIVVPTHLCTQWEREAKRFLPDIKTHVIKGFKNYQLPQVDVIITSYNRLAPWQDTLIKKTSDFRTVIFDEVHELRHRLTQKRDLAHHLSTKATSVLGLSGTPIFNYGAEIWSVLDVIRPGCLGDSADFLSEWCIDEKIQEPSTLNSYLKKQGLMLRRTDQQLNLTVHTPSKNVITLDADIEKLKSIQNVAKMLALSVLSGKIGEESDSAREFDWKLRHATGVSKARPVAEFTKMVLEQEEKVILVGWHRDVYDILQAELANYKCVMYTGSETTKEKDDAIRSFVEGDARVFIISLRSGAGLDGLQRVSNTVIFAELDWSPHVMDQVVGRLAREGQTRHVNAFYLNIADGSDPFIMGILGQKRSQHDGLIEGQVAEAQLLADVAGGKNRVKEMAAAYLQSIGEDVPETVPEEGLLGELTSVLRRLRIPINNEAEMQDAVDAALRENLAKDILLEKEFPLTKRSRLDFLASRGAERIAIECKIDSTKRADVYRQVRRYVEEGNIKALILLAPWNGVSSFIVDGTPVVILDITKQSI